MGFTEYLYTQLVADGVISEDETTMADLSVDMLTSETELYEDDIESYKDDYREYCEDHDIEPEFDLPEDQAGKVSHLYLKI